MVGVEDSYGATLERIKAQGGQKARLAMAALMWICHSERPLRVEELCQALAVKIGSIDYNADDVSSISTVLSCCQGLVVVDKEGSALRLVHFTLQVHLTSHPNLFQSPHATIAETCLTYLNSKQVVSLSASGSLSAQHIPFLEYSAIYWGAHMKKEFTHLGKTLALKLFSHYEHHISIKPLLEHMLESSVSIMDSYKFTALHCVCMFGLVEVARALMETDGVDINCMDHTGATPLTWAARHGEAGAVRVLLEREDINPNIPDISGRTPILWAAGHKYEEVVELLLDHEGANAKTQDTDDQVPIPLATKNRQISENPHMHNNQQSPNNSPIHSLGLAHDYPPIQGNPGTHSYPKPTQTPTYNPARPHLPPVSNTDHGELNKDMGSLYTGMPATLPIPHSPDTKHPPPTITVTNGTKREIIIAVMGATGNIHTCPKPAVYRLKQLLGVGKSYFIREVSGTSDIEVGDDLYPCKISPTLKIWTQVLTEIRYH